jgi:hypothetical protein
MVGSDDSVALHDDPLADEFPGTVSAPLEFSVEFLKVFFTKHVSSLNLGPSEHDQFKIVVCDAPLRRTHGRVRCDL